MPLYRLERYVGEATQAELDAGIFRAAACIHNFEDMRWIRSFYDAVAEQFTCYYEALSADDLRHHAELARVACDSVTEVIEYLPERYR